MKVYSYSQARQNLAKLLNESKPEDVLIRRRTSEVFHVSIERATGSDDRVSTLYNSAVIPRLTTVTSAKPIWRSLSARTVLWLGSP